MNALFDILLAFATSPWIYLVVLGATLLDAFMPPVPSETLVVAVAAIGAATGEPNLWLLAGAMCVGAFLGDNLTYLIGRRIGTTRFRWMRTGRVGRMIGWAGGQLERRGASLVLTARYIPVGRIAVNLVAGATGFPRRRFVAYSAMAAVSWAAYSVVIGAVAGSWFESNPLLGAGVGIVLAILAGIVIDLVMSARRAARDRNERGQRAHGGEGEAKDGSQSPRDGVAGRAPRSVPGVVDRAQEGESATCPTAPHAPDA